MQDNLPQDPKPSDRWQPALSDTQPVRTQPAAKASDTQPVQVKKNKSDPQRAGSQKHKPLPAWIWVLLALSLILLAVLLGSVAGYLTGQTDAQTALEVQTATTIQEQYQLGVQDLASGNYEVARQRFEYVLSQDPAYPGAVDALAQAMGILFATATPTFPPPTITPTATYDPRPIQDLFTQATNLLLNGEWSSALDTLVGLRKADVTYQVSQVDGMMYLALRTRGLDKILNEGNLQGGIYDLSLAEGIGPLDVDANNARTWARIYMIGTSFWEAYPELAVYYFGQVAAAAPGLRDSSGWTAVERYRAVLIQYGDQLAGNGDWCAAQAQYELAINIRSDQTLVQVYNTAVQTCSPPTATLTLTPTATLPYTLSVTLSPTATLTGLPTATLTLTPTFPLPSDTQTPTSTLTATPTPTPTIPLPTEVTPSPTP